MADIPKLRSPIVHVVMADGADWEVQILNPDLLRWDRTRIKHGWPGAEQAPMLWLTFTAWAASTREGLTALRWDDWELQAIEITTVTPDAPLDPMNPDRGPG